jgi:hypothetical protein
MKDFVVLSTNMEARGSKSCNKYPESFIVCGAKVRISGTVSSFDETGAMKRRLLLVVLLIAIPSLVWLGHPVCTPIPDEDLKSFTPVPIEQRHDRDLFLFATFQQRNGKWCQCKSWLARQMFF